jgi:Fe-S-cluster containining protein
MKLRVLEAENFSCHSCTNCCRDWHVELIGSEAQRISSLPWSSNDPLHGAQVLLQHGSKTYLAHRPDGSCVFLNLENGRCRIHEQFGADAKPLGCRLFPFQISPTFAGEASVTARYDCPTVRKNIGQPHADQLHELRRYAHELRPNRFFDEPTCCYLEQDQIQAVVEFVATLMNGFSSAAQRALFIAYLCDALQTMQVDELDRVVLAKMFPILKQQVEQATNPQGKREGKRVGLMQRIAFRMLLGMYLRRDEDVLNRRASRFGRAIAMVKFVLGFGGFRGLGVNHPSGQFRKSKLFKRNSLQASNQETFDLHWRMIRNKLESFQFMGPSNGGRNFLIGLRSLALLYPLVAAAAKYRAANRGASAIEPQDVDYAVGAIEHSFGRSAVLNQKWIGSIEKLLMQREVFTRLVRL